MTMTAEVLSPSPELRQTLRRERNVLLAERAALLEMYNREGVPIRLSVKNILLEALISRIDTLIAAYDVGIFGLIYHVEMQREVLELRSWMRPVEDEAGHFLAVYDTLAKLHHDDVLTGCSWPALAEIACRCGADCHDGDCIQRLQVGLRRVEQAKRKYSVTKAKVN
jgi:hypothetical protein